MDGTLPLDFGWFVNSYHGLPPWGGGTSFIGLLLVCCCFVVLCVW